MALRSRQTLCSFVRFAPLLFSCGHLGRTGCPQCTLCIVQSRSYLLHHRGGPHLPGVHSPVDTRAERFLSTRLIKGNIRGGEKKKQSNTLKKNYENQLVFTSAAVRGAGLRQEGAGFVHLFGYSLRGHIFTYIRSKLCWFDCVFVAVTTFITLDTAAAGSLI